MEMQRLHMTSPTTLPTVMVRLFLKIHNTNVLGSKMISEIQEAWNLSMLLRAVAMLIKLSSYTTWNTSKTVASLCLPCGSTLSCDFVIQMQP